MAFLRWARVALAIGAFAGLGLGGGAFANDTSAELTSGGLVLEHSADIEMRSEDLAISEHEIFVRYRFFNHGAADETVTVAFPMPDINWRGVDANIAVPDPESPNFLDFHTFTDGREVGAQYEQKAFADGVEISDWLTSLGVPLAPQSDATWKALDRLDRANQDKLIQQKIAAADDYDIGKGWEHHVVPNWTLKSSFYWSQTFPAGREITVEHRYTPSVGATTGTRLTMDPIDPADLSEYETRYCVDRPFMAAVRASQGKRLTYGTTGPPLFEKRIAYVLTTGANWAGPIGDFRLTVDKGSPDSLVSFCADGVKKIGPTLFELRRTNFTPTRDLNILILYPSRN